MEPERYKQLVAELEETSRTDARRLRERVQLLIALGYAYVLGVLLAVVGAAAGVIWMAVYLRSGGLAGKLVLALIVVAALIVRSLWVRTAPPAGRPFALERSPVLQRRVEEIRAALDAPRADVVLITDDFNASVTQIPRMGIFGWPKTYLTIGLPLMFGLEPRHFDAVLAHEFGHLSGAHPKLGLWVYRMSQTWGQLLHQLEASRSWASKLFEAFIRWYAPRLQAYGFVMSRRDEYEADADAARVTSAESMGEALMAVELRGRLIAEQFWPGLWRRVADEPTPPARSLSMLPEVFRGGLEPALRAEWMGRALTRRALDDDTHPSLGERLAALGITFSGGAASAEAAEALSVSAADHYLGESAHMLLATMEREWLHVVDETWKAQHNAARELRSRFDSLVARQRAGEALAAKELFEIATATAELDGEQAAVPHLRRVLEVQSDHAAAHFILGRALLALNDVSGIEHVRRAMDLAPEAVQPGSELLHQYYAEHGDESGLLEMRRRQFENAELMRLAMGEREGVNRGDTLVPHELGEEDLDRLITAVEGESRVAALWAARKTTRHLPDYPLIVLVVEPKWWRVAGLARNNQKLAEDVLREVQLSVNAHVLVLVMGANTGWLLRRMRKVPDACIFKR
jgi:Zn-dependent protease with chaperone function